jgi:ribulose-phosphate 3-epimerase
MHIYPSLISSNLLNIQSTLTLLDNHCDGYHLDIMDDHFVPNLTWGPSFINAIAHATKKPLHVHLMVDNPEDWIDRLKLSSKDYFIFHVEACKDSALILNIIKQLTAKMIKSGIALNPKTEITMLNAFLNTIDHLLLMSVEPGFSGQTFIPEVLKKAVHLNELKSSQQLSFSIGMDGGINDQNIALLKQAKVDIACIASAIFSSQKPVKALKKLYNHLY